MAPAATRTRLGVVAVEAVLAQSSASRCRRTASAWSSVDQALLEQLQHGQEADDDLQPLDQPVGQAAEGDAPDPGQLVDQLGHRLGHRQPDGATWVRSTVGTGRGAVARRKAGPDVVRGDALEQVRREGDEALLGPDPAGERARGPVGRAGAARPPRP